MSFTVTTKISTGNIEIVKKNDFVSLQAAQHWVLDDMESILPFSLAHDIGSPLEINGVTWQTSFTDNCYSVSCVGLGCQLKVEYSFSH